MEDFNIIEYDTRVSLVLINNDQRERVFYDLLKTIFFSKPKFYSLTESEQEISLFIDQNCLQPLEKYGFSAIHNYRFIQICESNPGIDHVGIVSKISTILAQSNIPILYVNTYNNNFILIKEDDYDLAIKNINNCFISFEKDDTDSEII